MFKETKIYSHKDPKLKSVYEDIYLLLKSIKSNEKKPEVGFYVQIIRSNPTYPEWLKRQMVKLVRRRIKLILENAPKKWIEFRLIVPRCRVAWAGNWVVPDGWYLRHFYFDSKNVFMTIGRKSKHGRVKHLKVPLAA